MFRDYPHPHTVEWDAIQRPAKLEKFKVNTEMNNNVGILRFFPGITASSVSALWLCPVYNDSISETTYVVLQLVTLFTFITRIKV